MEHPELLLVPVLIFLDYFLTVLGASLSRRKYAEHFRTEHYELNPMWQKAIAGRKWFNPRHIAITVLFTLLLVCVCELVADMPDVPVRGLLGFVIVIFGALTGRHLSNLLIFRYLIRRPHGVSGHVVLTHRFVLSLSSYQALVVVVPVCLIAVLSPSPFAVGGAVGTLFLLGVHFVWRRRWERRAAAKARDSHETATSVPGSPPVRPAATGVPPVEEADPQAEADGPVDQAGRDAPCERAAKESEDEGESADAS